MKYCEKRASKKKRKKIWWWTADLSGAGSRDGCPRLKVLQVPRKKKDAPMNVCDLRIRFDRCVCIEFQRRGNSVWVAFGVCVVQRPKALVFNEP